MSSFFNSTDRNLSFTEHFRLNNGNLFEKNDVASTRLKSSDLQNIFKEAGYSVNNEGTDRTGATPDVKTYFGDELKDMNAISGEEADKIAKHLGIEDGKDGMTKLKGADGNEYWTRPDGEGGAEYYKIFKGQDGQYAGVRTHVNAEGEVNYSLAKENKGINTHNESVEDKPVSNQSNVSNVEIFNPDETKIISEPVTPAISEPTVKVDTSSTEERKITWIKNGIGRDETNGFRTLDSTSIIKSYLDAGRSRNIAERAVIVDRYQTACEIMQGDKMPDNGQWNIKSNINQYNGLQKILHSGNKSDMQKWINANKESYNLKDDQVDALLNNLGLKD